FVGYDRADQRDTRRAEGAATWGWIARRGGRGRRSRLRSYRGDRPGSGKHLQQNARWRGKRGGGAPGGKKAKWGRAGVRVGGAGGGGNGGVEQTRASGGAGSKEGRGAR